MASAQCYKAAEQTCYQGQYYGTQPSLANTETQCASKTQTYYSESGLAKTETAQSYTQTNNPRHTHGHSLGQTHGRGLGLGGTAAASGCRTRKKRSEHGGLFQKLKDRLSGDTSSSSSDSESDDEYRARRKPVSHRCR
ncbi:hypothetical protein OWV82_014252 [Melia azedarach]|uniref:Uncharacterized protein n=1 Tax=Melia azedarach TaxID=155640 RepID=A0ACC1XNN8_MELAZ|nr:hypothetical protein OWV82_014252 [Melia azedarach]